MKMTRLAATTIVLAGVCSLAGAGRSAGATAVPSHVHGETQDGAAGNPACPGDCNDSGQVSVDEIIIMVNVALGNTPLSDCTAGDRDQDGRITVDEILAAVEAALDGCPMEAATPTPTATVSPTLSPPAPATPTASATATSTLTPTATSGSGLELTVAEAVARDAHGAALYANQALSTQGIVTVSAGILANNKLKIFIQDAGAGIMVYHQSSADVDAFQAGDRIRVTGVIRQTDPLGDNVPLTGTVMIDISNGSWVVLRSGNALPSPQTITLRELAANGIGYTGTLVSVANVRKVAGNWPLLGGKSTAVTISDDGGATQLPLRLQKNTFTANPGFVNKLKGLADGSFGLVGLAAQNLSGAPADLFGGFEIWIRGADDINPASP